jgi:uncharacterized protein
MIFSIPALIKVLFVFAIVLILNRMKLHLGLALIIGSFSMALWFENGLFRSVSIIFNGAVNIECVYLLIIIYLILALTLLMKDTGFMSKMISSVRGIVPSRRMAMAILPAMIGLLPMPGGAAVSAPMVEAADDDNEIDPAQKSAINYWFRHSWEYWWPLYPGILLAAEISGLSLFQIGLIQFPLTLCSLGFGAIFLLVPLNPGPKRERKKGNIKDLVMSLAPIAILMILWFLTGNITRLFSHSTYLPMIVGLAGSILFVQITGKAEWSSWKEIFKKKKTYMLLLVVIGVKIFSATLKSPVPQGDRIVDLLRENLKSIEAPEILIVMVIPFISGIVTGIAYGFVGASFPIVMSIAGDGASTSRIMSYVVLAYGFGYMGMMLSPVHVCLIVSNEYFNTKLSQSYKKLWGPALGVLFGAVIMSIIASRFG